MRVQAMFVGEDGSMGYRKGQHYELTLRGNLVVAPYPCPYTVTGFLQNWIITAIEGRDYTPEPASTSEGTE